MPHFTKVGKSAGRVIGVGDAGGILPLGRSELHLLPAHFMHAEGNFHFHDPVSKILFSGNLGVSMMSGQQAGQPVTDFPSHVHLMEGLHRRYMVSNKVLRRWVAMARKPDIAMRVPQHGAPLAGPAIPAFFDWIERLACGVDRFDERNDPLARTLIDPRIGNSRPAALA